MVLACAQDPAFNRKENSAVQSRSSDEDEEALDDAAEEEDEIEIDLSALPGTVKDAITARYPGSILREADRITQNDGTITYDVEIRFDGEVIEVMYDAGGTFLGEESEPD
jgi:hypothetical protein